MSSSQRLPFSSRLLCASRYEACMMVSMELLKSWARVRSLLFVSIALFEVSIFTNGEPFGSDLVYNPNLRGQYVRGAS